GEGRVSLSERLARGLPVLGATWLWQLLSRLDGPPSLLDPLAALLSWLFLEVVMVSIPPDVWGRWDLGNLPVGDVGAGPMLLLPPPAALTDVGADA
ncbi:unnamed protein product, partial [Laminaria digitata]